MTQQAGNCAYLAPAGEYRGACTKARKHMLAKLRNQNEQNALDALTRAVRAENHELYQYEINQAETYIKAAIGLAGDGE